MSFRTLVELFDAPTWIIRNFTMSNFEAARTPRT